jgi:serine/threonine protein phosphatase PrpC
MVTSHGVSHPGRVRKINEDAWRADPDLGLFLVADGMGGHNAGEVASGLAIEAVHGFIKRTREDTDVTWPFGIDPKRSYNANRLITAIKLANRRVFKAGESRDEYTGMGTTIVAVLIEGSQLAIAGVGDSRVYGFINGVLTQLTSDDSWVAAMAAEGLVSDPVPSNHPMRHVLTSVVGAREDLEVHMTERAIADGEVLLLCSDGLHGELDPPAITSILAKEADVVPMAETLVQSVLTGRAADNVTALVVQYRG